MTSPNAKSATALQNITGEINASFPSNIFPGETTFSRAPYHSQDLIYSTSFTQKDLNFLSTSGRSNLPNTMTSNFRSLGINLKKDIASGNYFYPHPDSPVTELYYSEMRKNPDNTYTSRSLNILEAELVLEVANNNCRYTSKKLSIKAETPEGAILEINADFDIFLTFE